MLKAAAESNVALKADPYEADSNHCPFKARHGLPIFEFYGKIPAYAGRFARAMAGATRSRQPRTLHIRVKISILTVRL